MSSRWISISARLPGSLRVRHRVHRLHQRGFAHAARAPQHRVVGRQAAGEAQRVVEQDRLLPAPPPAAGDIHARHRGHRHQVRRRGMPDEGVGRSQVHRRGGGGARRSSASAMRTAMLGQALVHRVGPGSLTGGGRKLWSRPIQQPRTTMPMLISPAYAQDITGMFGNADAVPAAGADLRRLLLPADPPAAAEAEGDARHARRR